MAVIGDNHSGISAEKSTMGTDFTKTKVARGGFERTVGFWPDLRSAGYEPAGMILTPTGGLASPPR
jgi:hypothetical protein